MKINILSIMFLILAAASVNSQDIHFSQFNENPSLVNPALTGVSNSIRASITNRDQWTSVTKPYKTMGASFETRFKSDSWQQHKSKSMVAAGLSFYRDIAGDGKLGQTRINFSLASFVALNKRNFISVGLQGSLVQRMLDNNALLFPNQYNGTVYDSHQSSNENFTNLKFNYFDLGAGAQWTYSREQKALEVDKQFTTHFGFAVYHLLQPPQEYLATLSKLNVKYVLHGDLIASIPNTHMAVSPSYLVQFQGSSTEIVAGMMLRHYLKNDTKYTGLVRRNCFGYGFYYRNKDAVLFSALLEWQEKLALIMSYDLNISALAPASSFRGGFEITLRYTVPRSFFYEKAKG